MAGLKHSNPHLSKFPGIFLGILLGLGWQNLPQSNFFPFWSLWEPLQLGAQSQKHLLHAYFPYLIGTASANATWGAFPAPSKEAEETRVQAPAPFLPVSLSLWSQDGYWRAFQRAFCPGTGAVAVKPIVTHLQRSSCHCDPTLQSTCTSWQSCWQTCKLCLFRALFPASFLCCSSLLKATPDLQQSDLDRVRSKSGSEVCTSYSLP